MNENLPSFCPNCPNKNEKRFFRIEEGAKCAVCGHFFDKNLYWGQKRADFDQKTAQTVDVAKEYGPMRVWWKRYPWPKDPANVAQELDIDYGYEGPIDEFERIRPSRLVNVQTPSTPWHFDRKELQSLWEKLQKDLNRIIYKDFEERAKLFRALMGTLCPYCGRGGVTFLYEFKYPDPENHAGLNTLTEKRYRCENCLRTFYEGRPDIRGIHCCDQQFLRDVDGTTKLELIGFFMENIEVYRYEWVMKPGTEWPRRITAYTTAGKRIHKGCYDITVNPLARDVQSSGE